ncbi:SbcC/MukB-like Walker B domain-containing protein [Streptomyces aureus]|uniref:SbcC/MukB-like Walker B domain-containing protein n=1 Tax=Streptomyces aureus TaxID=193461 RepID=UPI000559D3C1|nr:SbcC/MukB-like Walker B domain-containing protein [Streptomyces aureus]
MSDILDLDFTQPPTPAPSGNTGRFGGRWRLIGAGASNVWRYGDLDLVAPSGRLLLRGPNGTGKTTALEALWPYLLDLNGAKLAAGKARPTTLKLLMSEGAPAKGRRYGYLWLTFAAPDSATAPDLPDEAADNGRVVSFGARLQYSPSSTPAVKVVPFMVTGRPLEDLALRGPHNSALELEEFTSRVEAAGGRVFAEPEEYVEELAGRIWSTTAGELRLLASRLREVRNPTLLGDVSPAAAADALRQSLPGVAEDVVTATAEALAESDTTREAFARDAHAATLLTEFARVWSGHAVDVTRTAQSHARHAHDAAAARQRDVHKHTGLLERATAEAEQAAEDVQRLEGDRDRAQAAVRAIETSDAYRSHGHVMSLRKRLRAEQKTAAGSYASLHEAAQDAIRQTANGRNALDEVIGDIRETLADAEEAGGAPVALETLLAHHPRARVTRRVADRMTDPGPGITLTHDREGLNRLAATWTAHAREHRATADRATLVLRDHDSVAAAEEAAKVAHRAAAGAESAYDEAVQAQDRATAAARSAARRVLGEVTRWAQEHPVLRGLYDPAAPGGDPSPVWDTHDVDALQHAEPAAVRDQLTAWAEDALRIAERLAASHDSAAEHHLATAADLESTAAQYRAQAVQLRSGRLLPLPRPSWAGAGEDDTALGSLLEWQPALDDAPEAKALLELALAASGILSAHLHAGGATSHAWHISPTGTVQEHNLTAVLDIADGHPHADLARAVLHRIALADTTTPDEGRRDTTALVIGRDGTFTAGTLAARPATALHATGQHIPAASHVGARTRLTQARARADELDTAAQELTDHAAAERQLAAEAHRKRDALRAQGSSFPPQSELTTAEAERVGMAKTAHARHTVAQTLRRQADDATSEHTRLRTDWQTRARSLHLPADPASLTRLIDTSHAAARKLNGCATQLTSRLLPRLKRVIEQTLPDESVLAERLAALQHGAQDAHTTVLETQAELTEAQAHGDADDAARRYEHATAQAKHLNQQLKDATAHTLTAEKHLSSCESNLATAHERLTEALPLQMSTAARLRALLAWPPLARALDADPDLTIQHPNPAALITAVDTLLARRPTASKKTLGERYDTVRAELAQTWTIARGDAPEGIEGLDTFVLTHAETPYDPLTAADRAQSLASRAKAGLDAAEAAALRDFVIGRLPSAIGTAWAALTGWKKTVNRKMRSAQASSGVGVQVQIDLRSDLDPATRTVYELCCTVGDALRTDAQKEQVGQALQALLAAADGSTMYERLTTAVDIRAWVEVRYVVERPGPNGQPITGQWGSRTGLSGGERRLVVLAPMLAAIAAAYDRYTPTGLRLVPLDEVPAEVDERGREGLARYLAELDLDILCTSYLWDGAPGAWDGIDAHDLEAGTDGTVVAFPMHIRADHPLPGEADPTLPAGGAQ